MLGLQNRKKGRETLLFKDAAKEETSQIDALAPCLLTVKDPNALLHVFKHELAAESGIGICISSLQYNINMLV